MRIIWQIQMTKNGAVAPHLQLESQGRKNVGLSHLMWSCLANLVQAIDLMIIWLGKLAAVQLQICYGAWETRKVFWLPILNGLQRGQQYYLCHCWDADQKLLVMFSIQHQRTSAVVLPNNMMCHKLLFKGGYETWFVLIWQDKSYSRS